MVPLFLLLLSFNSAVVNCDDADSSCLASSSSIDNFGPKTPTPSSSFFFCKSVFSLLLISILRVSECSDSLKVFMIETEGEKDGEEVEEGDEKEGGEDGRDDGEKDVENEVEKVVEKEGGKRARNDGVLEGETDSFLSCPSCVLSVV